MLLRSATVACLIAIHVEGARASYSYVDGPRYTELKESSNPLKDVESQDPRKPLPHCWDVDGDGDFDCVVGTDYSSGRMAYWKNTGTRTAPNFVEQSTSNNPFSEVEQPRSQPITNTTCTSAPT